LIPVGYIDPSFGSLIFQVVAGTIFGALLTLRLWWSRVKQSLLGIFGQSTTDE